MTDAPKLPGLETPAALPAQVVAAPVVAEAAPPGTVSADAPQGAEAPAAAAPALSADSPPAPEAVVAEEAPAAEGAAPAPEAARVEPAAEAKPEGEAAPEAPKPPTYTEFKFPEGVKADPIQVGAYTGILAKYNLPQEAGQELVDLHTNAMKQFADQTAQHQQDVFAQTRQGWVKDFEKQAGNRRDTILNDAKFAITELVPDKKARTNLWNVLAFTGAGDNPAVIYAFASAAKRLRERDAPGPGLPMNGANTGTPADKRYGKTNKTA